jgi:hypothetical protein
LRPRPSSPVEARRLSGPGRMASRHLSFLTVTPNNAHPSSIILKARCPPALRCGGR